MKQVSDKERSALVKEADLESQAIAHLETLKILAFVVLSVGVASAYWGLFMGGPLWSTILGMTAIIVAAFAIALLASTISRARQNVRKVLDAAGVELGTVPYRGKKRR